MRALTLGALAAAALLAGPALATQSGPPEKTAPASDLSGVTVTPEPKADPLVDPAREFVRQHLPESPFSEQYPRFRDEICVKVQGLPEEFNAFVARRLIEVATKVHAPVAKAGDCTPNINVIFTPDPQAQMTDIVKHRDILIGYQFLPQLARLAKVTHPIEARYVTRTVGEHGENQLDTWDPDRYDPILDKAPPQGRAGSRLGNEMSAQIVHSLILADANKVAGEKIDAVADYITVLALARWQGLEKCNAKVSTILNLMAPGCGDEPPQAATTADMALLAALYAIDPRETGSQQRMAIASRMRSELQKANSNSGAH
jgi:hypothetical protein